MENLVVLRCFKKPRLIIRIHMVGYPWPSSSLSFLLSVENHSFDAFDLQFGNILCVLASCTISKKKKSCADLVSDSDFKENSNCGELVEALGEESGEELAEDPRSICYMRRLIDF